MKITNYQSDFPYNSALDCLLYVRLTRLDALVAISILAAYMKCPLKKHWDAVKDVFRYLKGTINRGLLYYLSSRLTLNDSWTIYMWVDINFATYIVNRRSRVGFLIYLNKNLIIAFNSSQQRGNNTILHDDGLRKMFPDVHFPKTTMDDEPLPNMSTTTCDVEYMTLSLGVKELILIYMMLKTMGINIRKPCVVYEDNRAVLKITYVM